MSNIMENLVGLLGGSRNLVVWSNDGVMQGKAYCKENEVASYLKEMLKLSNGKLHVLIEMDKEDS